jgi:hypothetical protein
MTPAERQQAYRRRLQRAELDSIGDEASASRVTLLASLSHTLAQLETERPEYQHAATRFSAGRIIQEILNRYGIELPKVSKPQAKGKQG